MPKETPPNKGSVVKLKSLEEQSQEIVEAAEELESSIYTCLYTLQDLGASHQELIGMLFDIQCTIREQMYEELE